MKIVKITLENDTRLALEKLQANSYGILRDRSLAVLHCADGKQIKWIAQALNRTPTLTRQAVDVEEKHVHLENCNFASIGRSGKKSNL